MGGARIKIMWEEQLADPPNNFTDGLCLYLEKI